MRPTRHRRTNTGGGYRLSKPMRESLLRTPSVLPVQGRGFPRTDRVSRDPPGGPDSERRQAPSIRGHAAGVEATGAASNGRPGAGSRVLRPRGTHGCWSADRLGARVRRCAEGPDVHSVRAWLRSVNIALRREPTCTRDPAAKHSPGAPSVPRHRRGCDPDEPRGPLRRIEDRHDEEAAAKLRVRARHPRRELPPEAGFSLRPLSGPAAARWRGAPSVRARHDPRKVTAVHKRRPVLHRRSSPSKPAARWQAAMRT